MVVDARLMSLGIALLVNLLLAVFVYKNNPKSATNIIFALLGVVTSIWLVDVYFSVTAQFFSYSLLWVRLSIFFAAPQLLLFFLLAHTLPSEKLLLKRRMLYLLLAMTFLMMTLALTPLAFEDTKILENSVQAVPGQAIGVFGIYAITMSIAAIAVLFLKLRNANGYVREQYFYVLAGIIIMLGLLIGTVLIPVAVFDNSSFVPFIPLYSIIFLGITTYAIVKKHLFDIRALVAKAVAYLMLVGVLGFIYAVMLFGVSALFLDQNTPDNSALFIYIFLALILNVTFDPLKKFFARWTNKLFYQDAYDIKQVIDAFGSVLVASIDLNLILKATQSLLDDSIKPVFSHLYIENAGNQPYEYDTRGEKFVRSSAFAEMIKVLVSTKKTIIIADQLDAKSPIKSIFLNNGVEAALRLETKTGQVGYVLLGQKQNGSIYTKQDVDLLTIVGNELALAVQNAIRFQEVSTFNLTLQKKVDDATHELQNTNEKLRALDQAKDEFISMASHQLRTPLTSVKGYVSMVLDGDVGPISDEQRDLLQQSFTSSQRMVYLIADLLNVSRLRTGKFVIENKDTDLAELIDGEVKQLKESAQSRELKLVYQKPRNFPSVQMDETKIRQVVMNFIDNAIYYTPKGGTITVEVKETPKAVEFTSTDNGIGISKEAQKSLFGKFFRADNAKKARPDGTGLGLYMAKKVIVAQGGSLIFHSEEGKGSTFGFTLPKDVSDRPKEPVTMDDDDEAPGEQHAATDAKVAAAAGTESVK